MQLAPLQKVLDLNIIETMRPDHDHQMLDDLNKKQISDILELAVYVV